MEPLAAGDPGLIAGYRVQARLGVGSAGTVYLAGAPDGRPVAVTVVRPEFAADRAFRDRLTWVLKDNGTTNGSGALSLDTAPSPYSFSGDTLREYGNVGSSTVFARVGH